MRTNIEENQRKEKMIMLETGKDVKTLLTITMAFILAAMLGCKIKHAQAATGHKHSIAGSTSWNFDKVPVGKLPAGWKVEATNLRGPMETWQVIKDTTAPSGKRVLAMTSPNHTFGGTFNICWTDQVSFLDGELTVRFKAVAGKGDQGGGIMWRVQDKENYYIARYNPLEDNFRFYSVNHGHRRMLADAKIALPAEKWHTMKIVQRGNRFEGYLNGKRLLDGTNNLFKKVGGVGLWTKADSVTSFDDFTVKPLKH